MYFDELDLEDEVLDGLEAMNFFETTPVQEATIPLLLERRDMIACAQTGTGKTAAYLLPIINRLSRGEGDPKKVNAVIMAPTRELAIQIEQQVEVVHARADSVAARGHAAIGVAQRTCGESEGLHLAASGRVSELTAEAVERLVGADVDVGCATRWGEVGGQEQVGAASTADDEDEEQEGDDNFLNHPYAETSGV